MSEPGDLIRGDLPVVGRFRVGDHLRVRRALRYWHHGIYLSDARVIQFGGRVSDKPRANIEAVSLAKFEDGSPAEIVIHPRLSRFGFWLPAPDPSEVIVRRAKWLLASHPSRRYNLIGWNCEHAANWCVNEFTESLQVRKAFGVRAIVGCFALLYLSWLYRTKQEHGWQYVVPFVAFGVLSLGATVLYNLHIHRFWKDLGAGWRSFDRATRGPVRG